MLMLDRRKADVEKFLRNKAVTFPVLMATPTTVRDFGGVITLPVSFLVDKEGNVVKRYRGDVRKDVLAKDVRKVLKKP